MSERKIWLASNDGVVKEVDRAAVEVSILLKNLLGDLGDGTISRENPIPIPEVKDSVLTKILEWCARHMDDPPYTPCCDEDPAQVMDMDEWDREFMQVDQEMLFDIILASNYLEIPHLIDIGCGIVAGMIKGKSPEDIRHTFGIPDPGEANE